MAALLVHLSLGAYLAACVAYLAWLIQPRPLLATGGRGLLALGLVLHLASLTVAVAASPEAPWRGGQLFSMLAAATVVLYLVLDLRYGLPVAGTFVAPLTIAAMVPAHLGSAGGGLLHETRAHLAGWLLPVHVAAAALGTVALLLAFALAVIYLASERQLKRKQPGKLFSRLPSLELVDRVGWQLVVWGFVLLTAVVITGSFVTREEGLGFFKLDPKSGFALLAWGLLGASIQARLVAGWRGRRIAVLVVVGFVLLVCSYAGLIASSPIGVGGVGGAKKAAVISLPSATREG